MVKLAEVPVPRAFVTGAGKSALLTSCALKFGFWGMLVLYL